MVLWIANEGIQDSHVRAPSDNTGVIGALLKGRSRSMPRNYSICYISHCLASINVTLDSLYVMSVSNKADPISHGKLGPANMWLTVRFVLPKELDPFLTYV